MGRHFPWLTLLYLVVAGGLVGVAYLLHFRPPLLQLAVAATLPWSLGHGLFVWSAIHGLAHELALYLVACLGLNAGLIGWLERRRLRRRAAARAGLTPRT